MKPQILRGLRFLFSLVVAAVSPLLFSRVACGPTGVSGAGGPVCGAGLLCGARPLCVPVGGGPPARSPHASFARSGRSRGPPWPCRHPPAPRPGLAPRSPARPRHRPSISHVFPLRLVQTLNLRRWNCNVFEVSRKMTTINYVRNLGGGSVVAARGRHSQAPCLEAFPVLSFACNSLTPAVRHLAKSLEFQRLHFKA